jgi:hypothetical protein
MGNIRNSRLYRSTCERQRKHLESHRASANVPSACIEPILECVLPSFAEADAEALRYQRWFHSAAVTVYCLSACAATIAIAQLLYWRDVPGVIWFEVGAMLAALTLVFVGRQFRWQQRWLHARYRAEQLRTAMFVLLIPGARSKSGLLPVQVLPFYAASTPQLHVSVPSLLQDPRLEKCTTSDFDAARRFLAEAWIRDQATFHDANARRQRRQNQWMHWIVVGLFGITLVFAAAHASEMVNDHDGLGRIAILLTIVLPAWAAAVHGISDLFEWERIGKRSERMAEILHDNARAAEEAASVETLSVIADQAESIMAIENYEWLVSLGFRRPPPVPT